MILSAIYNSNDSNCGKKTRKWMRQRDRDLSHESYRKTLQRTDDTSVLASFPHPTTPLSIDKPQLVIFPNGRLLVRESSAWFFHDDPSPKWIRWRTILIHHQNVYAICPDSISRFYWAQFQNIFDSLAYNREEDRWFAFHSQQHILSSCIQNDRLWLLIDDSASRSNRRPMVASNHRQLIRCIRLDTATEEHLSLPDWVIHIEWYSIGPTHRPTFLLLRSTENEVLEWDLVTNTFQYHGKIHGLRAYISMGTNDFLYLDSQGQVHHHSRKYWSKSHPDPEMESHPQKDPCSEKEPRSEKEPHSKKEPCSDPNNRSSINDFWHRFSFIDRLVVDARNGTPFDGATDLCLAPSDVSALQCELNRSLDTALPRDVLMYTLLPLLQTFKVFVYDREGIHLLHIS